MGKGGEMIDYYIHTFKCGECSHFKTNLCPFETTKESIANPDCFKHNIITVSSTGTNTEISTQGIYTTNKTE